MIAPKKEEIFWISIIINLLFRKISTIFFSSKIVGISFKGKLKLTLFCRLGADKWFRVTVCLDQHNRRERDSLTRVENCHTRTNVKDHSTGRAHRHKSSTGPPTPTGSAVRGIPRVTRKKKVFSRTQN